MQLVLSISPLVSKSSCEWSDASLMRPVPRRAKLMVPRKFLSHVTTTAALKVLRMMLRRILAIDDREPYLKILQAGLAQFVPNPLTATSGKEGLRILQEAEVDLVICDLGLPDLDGWEVSRRIKQICMESNIPKPPFILLTGRTDRENMYQEETAGMADSGVDAIVGKPTDIPEILEVAGRLLSERKGSTPT